MQGFALHSSSLCKPDLNCGDVVIQLAYDPAPALKAH